MSSFIAAGTSYSNNLQPMIPFFIYYSMFGFQRIGDSIWAAADMRTKGFLIGGTAGKTTLAVHLAMGFIKYHNFKVAVIDTDPQGSLGKWFMIRSENKIA